MIRSQKNTHAGTNSTNLLLLIVYYWSSCSFVPYTNASSAHTKHLPRRLISEWSKRRPSNAADRRTTWNAKQVIPRTGVRSTTRNPTKDCAMAYIRIYYHTSINIETVRPSPPSVTTRRDLIYPSRQSEMVMAGKNNSRKCRSMMLMIRYDDHDHDDSYDAKGIDL